MPPFDQFSMAQAGSGNYHHSSPWAFHPSTGNFAWLGWLRKYSLVLVFPLISPFPGGCDSDSLGDMAPI